MKRNLTLILLLVCNITLLAQEKSTITLKLNEPKSEISPLIYGQFIEFLGNCIDKGIYEADSPLADENGFRADVLTKAKDLNIPLLRYPAGTYIKIFNWENGIGPKEQRPKTRNVIWGGMVDNQFGTAEFVTYCREIGAEPNLVVNMSTATAMDAANWVEYCNGTSDSYYANLRRSHGYPEPFNVKYWAIGNEEEANDDAGIHQDPEKYVETAWQIVKLMKLHDPTIKIVLCGGSDYWNKTILDKMNGVCDYLSMHIYHNAGGSNEYGAVLKNISKVDERLDAAETLLNSYPEEVTDWGRWYRFPHRADKIKLAVDEWGIWLPNGTGPYNLVNRYTWEHALGVAMFFNTFHKHASSIGLATWAQLVNILAPILTDEDGSITQTVYYPMQYYRKHAAPVNIPCTASSPSIANGMPSLSISATASTNGDEIVLFAVNIHPSESLETTVDMEGDTNKWKITQCIELNAPSTQSMNKIEEKGVNVVEVKKNTQKKWNKLLLPPHSITILHLKKN
ncbi:alpha-L-arabinofuranosidase C-terminal domain-containing protein [Sunxiuqinia sp. A32]|uniref:alpha-L-arabinofuranosidase C-terminal domain-containing protein n=1 Tax=Sunxiuqinia sp. A32 TaxID=3461496 RepID=UPI0040459307